MGFNRVNVIFLVRYLLFLVVIFINIKYILSDKIKSMNCGRKYSLVDVDVCICLMDRLNFRRFMEIYLVYRYFIV